MDRLIYDVEIEKILAENFGLDENDVRIHILDGCHCVAIMPDEAEKKEQEDGNNDWGNQTSTS